MADVTLTATQVQQLREALDIGLDAVVDEATRYHDAMRGYRQAQHDALDADVAKMQAAATMLNDACGVLSSSNDCPFCGSSNVFEIANSRYRKWLQCGLCNAQSPTSAEPTWRRTAGKN